MSYENAPATLMLASHCAICRRPLVDAVSVECGIGPDCRENSGYYVEVNEDARAEANKITNAIARGMSNDHLILNALALRTLGFDRLADTVIDRNAALKVRDLGNGTIAIHTPYHSDFVARVKAATPWAKFDRETRAWIVPAGQNVRNAVFAAMKWCFPGSLGLGPKGPFTTPAAEY